MGLLSLDAIRGRGSAQNVPTTTLGYLGRVAMGVVYLACLSLASSDWPSELRWLVAAGLGLVTLVAVRDLAAWLLATDVERRAFVASMSSEATKEAPARPMTAPPWAQGALGVGLLVAGVAAFKTQHPLALFAAAALLLLNGLLMVDRWRSR